MNQAPITQTELYGLKNEFNELVNLYLKKKLPNKILLSGQKGIGKCTLAYHLINYVLSKDEIYPYNFDKLCINHKNHNFKLIQNGTNPNFFLLDINLEKKNIDITQIRNLINELNKSSFNNKPRFVLIDNIEFLNINSINALLKILEEPNHNIFFILINNDKKIIPTLLSRCLNFRISLNEEKKKDVCKKLFKEDIANLINNDLINYYYSPGEIFQLFKFSYDKEINLKTTNLKDFLLLIINKSFYKESIIVKNLVYNMFEFFLIKNVSLIYSDLYRYFLKRINETKKFNLDEESLFLEIKTKLLNE